MMLLHKNLFASKWMQALHMAVGESFSADSAFAMLYVMYNPVCRKDINRKRCLANKMLNRGAGRTQSKSSAVYGIEVHDRKIK